jgi:hypothetical protein
MVVVVVVVVVVQNQNHVNRHHPTQRIYYLKNTASSHFPLLSTLRHMYTSHAENQSNKS